MEFQDEHIPDGPTLDDSLFDELTEQEILEVTARWWKRRMREIPDAVQFASQRTGNTRYTPVVFL